MSMGFMVAAASRKRDDHVKHVDNVKADWRPWPEPHIPPYLDYVEPSEERRVHTGRRNDMPDEDHDPYMMRDRNVVNIRDYQDKRRIGFGEDHMHHAGHHEGMYHMSDHPMHDHMTHEEIVEWVEELQNADPDLPRGPKWQLEAVKPLAAKHGFVTPDQQTEFWAVMNMMYSDYCGTAKKHGVSTMDFYADMAKAWMLDKDAVEGKTAAYIECCTK